MVFLHALQHKMRYAQCTSTFSILLYTCFIRMTRNRLTFFVLRHVSRSRSPSTDCILLRCITLCHYLCLPSSPQTVAIATKKQRKTSVELLACTYHILFGSSTSFLFVDFLFDGKLQYCKEHHQRKMLIVKLCRIDYTLHKSSRFTYGKITMCRWVCVFVRRCCVCKRQSRAISGKR